MKTFLRLLAGTTLLGFAGCNVLPQPQADTVRYFTLSTATPTSAPSEGTAVRPVQLAGHLRNRAMAVRVGENEVIYLDDVRWAESLGDAITQLLRTRLGSVGGGSVVSVQVQRCELVRFESNAVQLSATYSILSPGDGGLAKRGVFTASPRTWDGKDYGTLVSRLRDAVGELGEAIATALPEKK